jgi:DNA-binding response OmpR family regulator
MIKKLLIADDNVENLELLVKVLQRFRASGLDILTATDGAEAYAVIQKEKPDLVLLDLMMPGMDGYEICRQVKANPETEHTYIIMVSAKTQAEDRRRAAQAGADEYVTKPFDIAHVLDRVRAVLNVKPV